MDKVLQTEPRLIHRCVRLIAWVCAIVFFVWAAYVLDDYQELPQLRLDPELLSAALVLSLLILILLAYGPELLARAMGLEPLKLRSWSAVGIAAAALNGFLPLKPGIAFRLGYYKAVRGANPVALAAMLASLAVMSYAVAVGVVIAGASHVIGPQSLPLAAAALLVLFLVLAGAKLLVSVPPSRSRWISDGFQKLALGVRAFTLASNHQRVALICTILLAQALALVKLAVECLILDIPPDLSALLLFVGASVLSGLVALTTGGIGVREAAVSFASMSAGLSPEQAVSLALLDRVVDWLLLGVLGPIAFLSACRDMTAHRAHGPEAR